VRQNASVNISQQLNQSQQSKPKLNQKSLKIAELTIKKLANGKHMNHQDYLTLKGKDYQKKHQREKEEQEKRELALCTFAPAVNKRKRSAQPLGPVVGSVFDELHSQFKDRLTRRDKSPEEIEYEKYMQECTFKPKMSATSIRLLERNKGSLCGSKNYEQGRSQAPAFIVGVQLSNGFVHHINVYEQQTTEEAVLEFAHKQSKIRVMDKWDLDLSAKVTDVIMEQVKEQIGTALSENA